MSPPHRRRLYYRQWGDCFPHYGARSLGACPPYCGRSHSTRRDGRLSRCASFGHVELQTSRQTDPVGAMSACGPKRRNAAFARMSAIRGTTGLVVLTLSCSTHDPKRAWNFQVRPLVAPLTDSFALCSKSSVRKYGSVKAVPLKLAESRKLRTTLHGKPTCWRWRGVGGPSLRVRRTPLRFFGNDVGQARKTGCSRAS
jgi:hypothetical protein